MPIRSGSQKNFNKIPVLGLVPESASTAPASPVNGQLWYDSANSRLKVYYAGTWTATDAVDAIPLAQRGAALGVATLDAGIKIPIGQIPTATSGTSSSALVPLSNDARLSDQRVPTDASVTGGTAGTGVKIAAATITDANVNALNKDGAAGTPSLRTLGTGAQQALAGSTRLDQITAPTAPVSLNGQELTNLAAPGSSSSAANKSYVDAAVANARLGITGVKDPVIVVAQSNVNLAAPGATIDGVTMTTGTRFLAPNQTTATQNGIYVWNGSGAAATRATDANDPYEVADGTLVAVGQGTDAGKQYIQTTTDPGTAPGGWAQVWTVFSSGGQTYLAGNGLSLTGTTFAVVAADASISVGSSGVTVGLVPVAKGGTGATTAAAARTALGTTGKYAADLAALVAGTELTISHNLNSSDVQAMFRTTSDGYYYELAWRVIDANTIGVTADVASGAGAVRVVVMG